MNKSTVLARLAFLAITLSLSVAQTAPHPVTSAPTDPKKSPPVFEGADPAKIAISDEIITQVIPVVNVDARKLRYILIPFYGPDADVASSPSPQAIVLTDTSAHVHQVALVISILDKPGALDALFKDPPLPAGAADSIEARMAARRALQAGTDAPPAATGARGGRGGTGTTGASFQRGGFGGVNAGALNTPAQPQRDIAAEKKNGPVYTSADPNMIEMSDKIITQIIPLKYVDAVRLRADLVNLISADADIAASPGANSIIVTDVSSRVHHLVEIIAALDKQAASLPPAIANPMGRGGPARNAVLAPGNFAATILAPTAGIYAPADRAVAAVLVAEGEVVKRGQVLIEFQRDAENAELRIAEARLTVARSKLEALPAGVAPETERNQARAAAMVEEAMLELQRRKLESLQLRAPFDGTVAALDVKAGTFMRAGAQMTQVVGSAEMKVSALLPAAEGGRVKVGQKAVFSAGGKETPLTISFVSPIIDVASGMFEVRGQLRDVSETFKPGLGGILMIPNP